MVLIKLKYCFGVICALQLLIFFWANVVPAAETAGHEDHQGSAAINTPNTPALTNYALDDQAITGIIEQTGGFIPLDLEFFNEDGEFVQLAGIIDRPTLLLPVYFSCPSYCPLLLGNLANAVNDVIAKPAEEFKVIALSFDHQDTPSYAKQAKSNYMNIMKETFPQSAWSFLTGSRENIGKLTRAIGYTFKEVGPRQFTHPSVLVCLAGDGKIIRYVYGPDFLPLDLSMAIGEAQKGIPGVSIKKLIAYCFSYDPKGKKYVFNTFRVLGVSTFLILAGFYLFFLRKGNK